MTKINHKGRNKHTPFIKLHRGVTNSAAWKALTCEAKCLILLIWERHNGANNGTIPLSHREARKALGIGNTKTSKAFREAQAHGFIIERNKGSFDWKMGAGQGRATEWEITAEPSDGKPAKMSYRNWQNQIAAPDVGADGSEGGNRSAKTHQQKQSNGTYGGNRLPELMVVNGS